MKTLLIGLLVTGAAAMTTGCATPAYTGGAPTLRTPEERATGENANRILRGWVLDSRMLADDINSALLLGEPSRLTRWHVR